MSDDQLDLSCFFLALHLIVSSQIKYILPLTVSGRQLGNQAHVHAATASNITQIWCG
jgi:hypothetical protein